MKEKQNENKLNCSSAKDLSKVNLLPGLVYFRLMLYFILILFQYPTAIVAENQIKRSVSDMLLIFSLVLIKVLTFEK